jgi:hypothetical protein
LSYLGIDASTIPMSPLSRSQNEEVEEEEAGYDETLEDQKIPFEAPAKPAPKNEKASKVYEEWQQLILDGKTIRFQDDDTTVEAVAKQMVPGSDGSQQLLVEEVGTGTRFYLFHDDEYEVVQATKTRKRRASAE